MLALVAVTVVEFVNAILANSPRFELAFGVVVPRKFNAVFAVFTADIVAVALGLILLLIEITPL
jgi:hypothetical protein